jgi:hypothetical protein
MVWCVLVIPLQLRISSKVSRDTHLHQYLFFENTLHQPASTFLIILKECQRALGWKKVEKVIGQQNEWSTDEAAITQKQGLEIDKSSCSFRIETVLLLTRPTIPLQENQYSQPCLGRKS